MNDLKALTGSIIDQALTEAAQLEREIAGEVAKIQAQAQQQAEARSRKLTEEYYQKAETVERRLTIEAELEGRKHLLAAKRALIEMAFNQAIDSLAQLPVARRTAFLAGQLAMAGAESGGEVQTDGIAAEWTTIIKEANELLARSGKLAQLTLAKEKPDFKGGFRLTGPGFSVDGSYRALVGEVKESLIPKVAAHLFDNAEG